MKHDLRIAINVLILLMVAIPCTGVRAQVVTQSNKIIVQATLKDPETMQMFAEGMMLSADTQLDSMEFFDFKGDGFNEGDMIRFHPGGDILPLMDLNDRLLAVIANWEVEENKGAIVHSPESHVVQMVAEEEQSPFAGVLASLLRGIEHFYEGSYIEGMFIIKPETSELRIWRFNEDKMHWKDGVPGGASEVRNAFDLMKVVLEDTVFVVDTTMYDSMYIIKTLADTLFVPVEKPVQFGRRDAQPDASRSRQNDQPPENGPRDNRSGGRKP
ncbi:hypothetical protein GF324_13740 [bacterium]|nr:hypothetical protein [bacterium]